jgi:predicted nucleic acid-binding protein
MKVRNRKILLDTSALFAFTGNEDGANQVQIILEDTKKGRLESFISAMSMMELYYVTCQELGEDEAGQIVALARSLPAKELPLTGELTLVAGDLKARFHISVADAWIAATAKVHGLALMHKDPEFEPLKEELEILELPYKSRRA